MAGKPELADHHHLPARQIDRQHRRHAGSAQHVAVLNALSAPDPSPPNAANVTLDPAALQQLLGDYFPKYSESVKNEKTKYVGRRPLNIQQTELVVQTSGHMHAYYGRVFDPTLIPQNVSQELIK